MNMTPESLARIRGFCRTPDASQLPVPAYRYKDGIRLFLALRDYEKHTMNQGWLFQKGMEAAGYILVGKDFECPYRDGGQLAEAFEPAVAFVADKLDWDAALDGCYDKQAHFTNLQGLGDESIFRIAMIHDSHRRWGIQRQMHEDLNPHAWVCYYHPDIVAVSQPWIRKEHILRTYHSLDPAEVPEFTLERIGCIASGARCKEIYPLRETASLAMCHMPEGKYLRHPGYGNRGSRTAEYLKVLSGFRVAICTASIYCFAVRKIIEATACGCIVITDLPAEEEMPNIDGNLHRVPSDISVKDLIDAARACEASYTIDRQYWFAEQAKEYYDYRRLYADLRQRIEKMRKDYELQGSTRSI